MEVWISICRLWISFLFPFKRENIGLRVPKENESLIWPIYATIRSSQGVTFFQIETFSSLGLG
eukprot:UN25481